MAELSYTEGEKGPNYKVYTYTGATNGGTADTFEAIKVDRVPYSVTIAAQDNDAGGAWSGNTAAIALHGSVDGTNYSALADRASTAISITSDTLVACGDVALYYKPVLSGADSGTDVDVQVLIMFDSK